MLTWHTRSRSRGRYRYFIAQAGSVYSILYGHGSTRRRAARKNTRRGGWRGRDSDFRDDELRSVVFAVGLSGEIGWIRGSDVGKRLRMHLSRWTHRGFGFGFGF